MLVTRGHFAIPDQAVDQTSSVGLAITLYNIANVLQIALVYKVTFLCRTSRFILIYTYTSSCSLFCYRHNVRNSTNADPKTCTVYSHVARRKKPRRPVTASAINQPSRRRSSLPCVNIPRLVSTPHGIHANRTDTLFSIRSPHAFSVMKCKVNVTIDCKIAERLLPRAYCV